ncbi:hypothetical protein NCS52_01519300 [Fusarium sp. LHS14.1]|nr:hypothetical protein NCS52_01519300 [Fusarium sp. LHS14.1]
MPSSPRRDSIATTVPGDLVCNCWYPKPSLSSRVDLVLFTMPSDHQDNDTRDGAHSSGSSKETPNPPPDPQPSDPGTNGGNRFTRSHGNDFNTDELDSVNSSSAEEYKKS